MSSLTQPQAELPTPPVRLFLIGYRATGKSTVAQRLAVALGWVWIDSDRRIEQLAGHTIAEIFRDQGEPAFRELESTVVRELCNQPRAVIALGGGAVVDAKNGGLVRKAGYTIWLQASPQTILERLRNDPLTRSQRPNLTPAGGLAEVEQLLRSRHASYQRCARMTIVTDDKSATSVADEIIKRLRNEAGLHPKASGPSSA